MNVIHAHRQHYFIPPHIAYLKKWTTPCPGPWSCRSRCSPGPSIWPLSPLKPLNLDSPWKISLWTCIMSLGLENKKYDKLLSGKNHVLVELCLLWVDAVHHEARSGPRPFDIMSATTKKDFRKRSHVDSIIFTKIRAKKTCWKICCGKKAWIQILCLIKWF